LKTRPRTQMVKRQDPRRCEIRGWLPIRNGSPQCCCRKSDVHAIRYIHPLSCFIDSHHNGNSPQPPHVMLPQLKCLPTLVLGVGLNQIEELPGARRFLSASCQFSIFCSVNRATVIAISFHRYPSTSTIRRAGIRHRRSSRRRRGLLSGNIAIDAALILGKIAP
jgi:hypothetical protein